MSKRVVSGNAESTYRVASISTEPARSGSAAEMHLTAIADGLLSAGLEVDRFWSPQSRPALLRVLRFQLRLLSRIRYYDALYFRWHILDLLPTFAARVLGVPYVLEVNGRHDVITIAHPMLRPLRGLLANLGKWQLKNASAVITVSSGLSRWAAGVRGSKANTHTIRNGAPSALGEQQVPASKPRYAMYMGEFSEWQGLDILVEAKRSAEWPADLDLIVVGSGAKLGLIEQAASQGVLRYLGRLARAETHRILAGATMSISPQSVNHPRSNYTGIPFKITESMMLGVPVITSSIPDQAKLVTEAPTGYVFQQDSVEDLLKGVRTLMGVSPNERRQLSEFAMSQLSWDSAAKATAEIVLSAIANSSRR